MVLVMAERLYLPYSTGCFVCGHNNPYGLSVQFYVSGDQVCVDLNIQEHFNSYKNITHGGVTSAVLDEAMGWAAFIFSDSEKFLFTRELSVTYKKNVPLNTPLLLSTEFVSMERGVAASKGKITDMDGNVLTLSKGLFFPISQDKMEETKRHLCFIDGIDYHPKALKYCKSSLNVN